MSERYPGYDVLAKRHTPSWNEQTRRVIDQRLALPREPRFLDGDEWQTLEAMCGRIVPQPQMRPPVPIAAMVDAKLFEDHGDGYRDHRLPPLREAWRRGLRAIDAEAHRRHGVRFHTLDTAEQDALLRAAQDGRLAGAAWHGMDCALFFAKRLLPDIVTVLLRAIPSPGTRSALAARRARAATCGWISTAAIRGKRPRPSPATRPRPPGKIPVSDDPQRSAARQGWPRARRFSRRRLDADARISPRTSRSISPSSARAPAAARWPAGSPRPDSRSSLSMSGRGGGRSKISLPTRPISKSSIGPTSASATAPIRWCSAPTTAASRSAAAPYILRWCHCAFGRNGSSRAACSATARIGRSIGARCGATTARSSRRSRSPVRSTIPWGPKRPRYPYRPHELNAAALVLAKGAEAMGIGWAPTPLATISAPRGRSHPCVYRGFCVSGCATNAKQSALITWIPRAVKAGAEIRDLAMVGRIETDPQSGLRHRRALLPRAQLAVSAGKECRRRRLCDRDAEAAAEFGGPAPSRRSRQQFGPRRARI